jgi:hypothetical protein
MFFFIPFTILNKTSYCLGTAYILDVAEIVEKVLFMSWAYLMGQLAVYFSVKFANICKHLRSHMASSKQAVNFLNKQ